MRKLAQELVERAERAPDVVAVIDGEGEHTLRQMVTRADEIAALLDECQAGPPTVLVQADNSWRTLAAAIAVGLRGGLIAVISGHATRSEYELALEDIEPDAVIASPQALATWRVDDSIVPRRRRGARLVGRSARQPDRPGEWSAGDGGVVIAMTSGSTGRPKCVVQSEAALRYAGQATIDAVGLQPGDPVGALVPLSSVAAFCFGMHLPAMLGSPMVCLDKWSAEDAVALLRDRHVRWTMLVPTMALQLSLVAGSDGALSSLTAMTVGGGPMDARALENAERHLGTRFLRVFGMSECLGHTTPLPSDPADDPPRARRPTLPGHRGQGGRHRRPAGAGRRGGQRPGPRTVAVRRVRPRRRPTTARPHRRRVLADRRPRDGQRRRHDQHPRSGEADHHPRWPQHRHQRGRGVGGGDPRRRPGVRRTCAGRPAGGARCRAGGLRRQPSWVSTRCASSSGLRTSRSSSGRSSCTPYPRSRRTGLGSSTAAMRSRWRHSSPRPKPDAIVLAEARRAGILI